MPEHGDMPEWNPSARAETPTPPQPIEWNSQDVDEVKRKLITANHILHHHGVVDGYGHISVRHPSHPDKYLMSGYLAPALVSSPDDLIEYWINDSSPVSPHAKKGYSERFIHGIMYAMYPKVNCVIHSHAEAVLPYATSGVPLMPVIHMAGFLGNNVPVFDIGDSYSSSCPDEQQDLLVRTAKLGIHLAEKFVKTPRDPSFESHFPPDPDYSVVLMRRHGYTTHGRDIETAVYRAIYTKINATAQTNSMILRGALPPGMKAKFELEFLTDEMCRGCSRMNEGTHDKPWKLWVAEVENSSLYTNRG